MKVKVTLFGNEFEVPDELTVLTALEYCGYTLTRGCGCRGGFCGACAIIYRLPGDFRLRSGLACQQRVEAGMDVLLLPSPPRHRGAEFDPERGFLAALNRAHPEAARCLGCGTCVKVCPQELEPMTFVQAALRGDAARAAEASFDCIMCGLCALRCPAELSPYQIALFVRRAHVRLHWGLPAYLAQRVAAIRDGAFDTVLAHLRELGPPELARLYESRDFEPI
jgi:ferredoxin